MLGRLVVLVVSCAAIAGLSACGGGGSKDPNAKQFASLGCASCHTLKAAGATGGVGPNLDELRPNTAQVVRQVTNGGDGMPSFRDKLSASEIRRLSAWVARVAGRP